MGFARHAPPPPTPTLEAVFVSLLVQDPESESRPHFAVKLKISTGSIRIADSNTDVSVGDKVPGPN